MESLPVADAVIGLGVAVLILRMVFEFVIKVRNGRNEKKNHDPGGNPGQFVMLAPGQTVELGQKAHDKLQRIEDGIAKLNITINGLPSAGLVQKISDKQEARDQIIHTTLVELAATVKNCPVMRNPGGGDSG